MKKIIVLVLIIIANCTLKIEDCASQWLYQALPSYYEVIDVKFFDANTGLMIFTTSYHGMLRTTNGGNNWTLIHPSIAFYQLEKIDSTTLYAIGRWSGVDRIQRTYDKGQTWDSVSVASYNAYTGLSFINRDTGWVSGANYLNYNCIWKTINGGITLTQLTDTTGMGNIHFLKYKIGSDYIGWLYGSSGDNKFWKTTNSGVNWFQVTKPPALFLGQFGFYNDNTGWFIGSSTGGGIYKSTNGGTNWTLQTLPSGSNIDNSIGQFQIINSDTLYGCGGFRDLGSKINALIWKTTNGGVNWGYQELDTAFHIGICRAIDFINANTGWAYQGNGVHTTNGGGPITYTAIQNSNEIIPKDYVLSQNYPNPFNQLTVINYQLTIAANIKLTIYDITGKGIKTLINERKSRGDYSIRFDAGNLASGVYFYSLIINGNSIETKKMMLLK